MADERYRLVYSDNPPPRAPGSGKARIRLERKGRAGKTVTIIEGLALSDDQLRLLLKKLQHACGTGGTLKEHHLELQGDVQSKIRPLLAELGYRV